MKFLTKQYTATREWSFRKISGLMTGNEDDIGSSEHPTAEELLDPLAADGLFWAAAICETWEVAA